MTNSKRVLIADDDEGVVDALARRCQALDLRVERAYDGISALTKIDTVEPDFIILDINMPCGSGLSVCEMVARDAHLKTIPIIVLTGRSDNETIAACNRLDTTYVLKGPSIWSQIEPLLCEHLRIVRPIPPDARARAAHRGLHASCSHQQNRACPQPSTCTNHHHPPPPAPRPCRPVRTTSRSRIKTAGTGKEEVARRIADRSRSATASTGSFVVLDISQGGICS